MGIGGRIRDWVNDQAEEWGERFGTFIGNAIGRGGKEAVEEIDPELLKAFRAAFNMALNMEFSPSAKQVIDDLAAGKPLSQIDPGGDPSAAEIPEEALARTVSALGAVIGAPLGLLPFIMDVYSGGYGEFFKQGGARTYRPTRLQPKDAVSATWRGIDEKDWAGADLAALGFSDDRIRALGELYRPLLSPDLVRILTLRFSEDHVRYRDELTKAGYTPEQIGDLEKLHAEVPPLADMVRFADFGSFDPAIITAWRDFYDAPDWITEPFALLGITNQGERDWANKYWFSHWRQPGRFELGEMHRRGLLGGRPFGETRPETAEERSAADDIVRRAYLTQGFSSFWQGRLLDLVGENLTRVDIRRMHKIDVLDDEQLADAYHRIGYYGANNDHMVEFTKRYNATDDRELTKSEIVRAYSRKTIERPEAVDLLLELGYGEDEVDFILESEDYVSGDKDRALSEAKLKALFLAGLMPKIEVTAALADSGYDAAEIERIYQLWDLETGADIKLPTRSELFHFFQEDIITEAEFVEWMKTIGYPAQHIDWYLAENAADELADARKEEERARLEADRIETAAVKSAYEEQRARLDVELAVIRVFTADAKKALLDVGTDAERVALRDLNERERQALGRLNLDQRQAIARLALELRIAVRGASPDDREILERATLAERQAIEFLTINEREVIANLALTESEEIRAEISSARANIKRELAGAAADTARLKLEKAELKLK